MNGNIQVVGFDADDTLWVNESYFQEAEEQLRKLLLPFVEEEAVVNRLNRTEAQNMELYGYGVKAYILSMIETAIEITDGKVPAKILKQIIEVGKEQLSKPVELLDGAQEALDALQGKYKLILVTKGDLLDQERKLQLSGLEPYFHHVEIMSNKTEREYRLLLQHQEIDPDGFVMIGNSVRSDILPPLELGCYAVYVPSGTTWEHEWADEPADAVRYRKVESLREVVHLL